MLSLCVYNDLYAYISEYLQTRLDDGRWHRIKVMRKRRVGVLQVDKNRPIKGKSAKGSQVLNTDGYLWIGQ